MDGAIFLSAGVPDPRRGPQYAATAEPIAIAAAVSGLITVVLGRRRLVWGGQPAITPMVWTVSQELGIEYGDWVKLYQSRYFEDQYPEDNARFSNTTYIDAVGGLDESLASMRRAMFASTDFAAAVFIGGMKGILDEYELFAAIHPNATILPIASTGGAALNLYEQLGLQDDELVADLDYIGLLHRRLQVDPRERRFSAFEEQPEDKNKRYWTPEGGTS